MLVDIEHTLSPRGSEMNGFKGYMRVGVAFKLYGKSEILIYSRPQAPYTVRGC